MRLTWGIAPLLFCQFLNAQVIAIYPAPTRVEKGTSRQFSKYVAVSPSGVSWTVNGVTGGSAKYGTVTQDGLYKAPGDIPTDNVVKVRATSTSKPTIFGESVVTITQPTPWLWSTYPNSFSTGTGVSMSLNGSNFLPTSVVRVNGVVWSSTYVSATAMKAVGRPADGGNVRG